MADKIGTDEYGEILIYQTDDGQTNIEVKIEDVFPPPPTREITCPFSARNGKIFSSIISAFLQLPWRFFPV